MKLSLYFLFLLSSFGIFAQSTGSVSGKVIDQKTNIALISSISHPDIGVIKRAIETNAQRKVTIVNPKEIKSLEEYIANLSSFKSFLESDDYEAIFNEMKNTNRIKEILK